MGRGLFSGVIWGAIFAVMSLWLVSQLGGVIRLLTTPPTNVVDQAPKSTTGDSAERESAPDVPSGEALPATDPSRQGTSLAVGQADSAPVAETEPASTPQTSNVAASTTQPQEGTAPTLNTTPDVPTLTVATIQIPAQPSAGIVPAVAETAPQPAIAALAEVVPVSPDEDDLSQPQTDSAPDVAAEPGQPPMPAFDQAPATKFSNPKVVELPEAMPEPQTAETVDVAQISQPDEAARTPDVADAPASPDIGEAPVADRAGESIILQPITEIGDLAPKVRTNRLPTVGSDDQEPEIAPTEVAVEITTGPAIQRYAASFENPDQQPLMAIVLLVDSDAPNGEVSPLPFPVSYVVDASAANATDLMRKYRDAGHEVLALAPLPERATPADVEVAFQVYLSAVPEAVAVMDTRAALFQSGRVVATQIAAVLAASGHGMVTYSRGLNSGTQVAEQAGVPTALVFREFDNAGQDTATIKRFLDQAAFRARQQSGVILVGHNRPETIKALLEWSFGNRASTVALAPISAALLPGSAAKEKEPVETEPTEPLDPIPENTPQRPRIRRY
ncbi:MAG: divergent polysaccharide deacetylase family protein [Paracoccaceae bacterium]